MKRGALGLLAAVGVAGCGDLIDFVGSSEPPAAIARGCVTTLYGTEVLFAGEWVKPIAGQGADVTWERVDQGYVFRSARSNPLNGETNTVSILFMPAGSLVVTRPYCEGYFEPAMADYNGQNFSLAQLQSQMFTGHLTGLAHYGGQLPDGPLVLEEPQ